MSNLTNIDITWIDYATAFATAGTIRLENVIFDSLVGTPQVKYDSGSWINMVLTTSWGHELGAGHSSGYHDIYVRDDGDPVNSEKLVARVYIATHAERCGLIAYKAQLTDTQVLLEIPLLDPAFSGAEVSFNGGVSYTAIPGGGLLVNNASITNSQTLDFKFTPGDCLSFENTIYKLEEEVTPPIPGDGTHFWIPKLNGVGFIIPDGSLQNLDNEPYYAQNHPGWNQSCFAHRYLDTDTIKVQFQSDFDSHTIEAIDYRDKVTQLQTYTPTNVFNSPEGWAYWEFEVDMSDVLFTPNETIFFIKITANGTTTQPEGWSEPIAIVTGFSENEMKKVQWFNTENCCDMYWNSGIQPYLWVPSHLYKVAPKRDKEIYRGCDWNTRTLSRTLRRQVRFEVFHQPYFILEKLQWATGLDSFFVNNQQFETEEGFSEPEQAVRYGLASANVLMEQLDVFNGNRVPVTPPAEIVDKLLISPEQDYLNINPTEDDLLV